MLFRSLLLADIDPAAPRRATVRAKCVGDLGVPRLSSESAEKREMASVLSTPEEWRRDRMNAERSVSLEGFWERIAEDAEDPEALVFR